MRSRRQASLTLLKEARDWTQRWGGGITPGGTFCFSKGVLHKLKAPLPLKVSLTLEDGIADWPLGDYLLGRATAGLPCILLPI